MFGTGIPASQRIGIHTAVGGNCDFPNPGELLSAALAGCLDTTVRIIANRLGIPVISSPNGMGCIPMDDPLALGFIGRNGAYPANQAGRFADLVITVGTRFDDRSASSWQRPGCVSTPARRSSAG